jgi:hypothetical protein
MDGALKVHIPSIVIARSSGCWDVGMLGWLESWDAGMLSRIYDGVVAPDSAQSGCERSAQHQQD